jgi:hypothetical protein
MLPALTKDAIHIHFSAVRIFHPGLCGKEQCMAVTSCSSSTTSASGQLFITAFVALIENIVV